MPHAQVQPVLQRLETTLTGSGAALLMSVFLLLPLYVWIAGERALLPTPESEFEY